MEPYRGKNLQASLLLVLKVILIRVRTLIAHLLTWPKMKSVLIGIPEDCPAAAL
jgi:hypothetical protein